jgi:hypothetical protein
LEVRERSRRGGALFFEEFGKKVCALGRALRD